ncbi:CotO family spore coat protein [Ectobacillus funiculus]|uniref:CotO family spore coat protein n=1 Tax=Ectobacillus funiculus TaxID=137993 RepID=A0ABV5WPW6_9BACI
MKRQDKDRSEQTPLLYISQPHLKIPAASMQQSFILKSSSSDPATAKRQEDKAEPILPDKKIVQQVDQSILTEETEAVIPSAAAAVLEVVDSEEAISEPNSVEEQEAISESNSAEEQEAVLKTVSAKDEEASLEADSAEVPDSAVFQEKEERPASIIRKPFRDMNIEEKLSYLLHRPHYIPKVTCEVTTKTEEYVGYIVSFNDDVVELRTQSQLFMRKIPYEDIIDIQMRAL